MISVKLCWTIILSVKIAFEVKKLKATYLNFKLESNYIEDIKINSIPLNQFWHLQKWYQTYTNSLFGIVIGQAKCAVDLKLIMLAFKPMFDITVAHRNFIEATVRSLCKITIGFCNYDVFTVITITFQRYINWWNFEVNIM
jgi:hypothetical protein